ncbi:MAG: hypothetical protein K0R98_692 [Rickettsiaceae bacterium]|jgi:hypothetical protein|nr:hypothetical protein [Rickettsiaceae bacterium]
MTNIRNRLKKLESWNIKKKNLVPIVVFPEETEDGKKAKYFQENPMVLPQECEFKVVNVEYV